MRTEDTSVARGGLVVAHGHGLKVHVDRRHLLVEDGYGRCRRTRRFHRATDKLRRLVVIGRSGYVTLDALRWLHDVGAALVHIDSNAALLAASTARGPDLPALRRAQALAVTTAAGVEVARGLLAAKIDGQRALLDELPGGHEAIEPVEHALREAGNAADLSALLSAEAQAAAAYWQAWSPLPVPFAHRDLRALPAHWLAFGQRASLITGGPRLATNPAGALLNYLYALLEAETVLACHGVGLDPGLGIFHVDRRDRASLALDAMEAARPAVDAYLLALLTQRTLAARDFVETRQGACRLSPRMAAELADTCTVWRHEIAPVVESIAHTLARHAPARIPLLTPLTRRNVKQAWDERARDHRRRRGRGDFASLPNACRDCGAPVGDRRRRYCDDCRERRFLEKTDSGRQRAAEVLARLRSEQHDPAHGGRAAQLRGSKNAAHQAAVSAWRGERPDPAIFRSEILPGLRSLSISALIEATGLSAHYCSLIRLGKRVPHVRHWERLRRAAVTDQ